VGCSEHPQRVPTQKAAPDHSVAACGVVMAEDRRAVLPGFTWITLEYALRQAADFHVTRAARERICPVCGLHARYCGHTRDEMIAALLPRRQW
jgi:hypothetical protein